MANNGILSGGGFSANRFGTGTYEWADQNFNIQFGCPHGCLYCYACANALRFKAIKTREEWLTEKIKPELVSKKWRRTGKVIMFPTTHDITPGNIDACTEALKNMLAPGNRVLIVSKPHFDCIYDLCKALTKYKEQILFRFTIGSISPDTCAFWEPGAPDPSERISALEHAYVEGYQTSVSMEPMLLGYKEALRVYRTVNKLVTETVWIGKMNKARARVDMSVPDNRFMVERIEHLQRDEAILQLVKELGHQPKVRWKDSIKAVINGQGGVINA